MSFSNVVPQLGLALLLVAVVIAISAHHRLGIGRVIVQVRPWYDPQYIIPIAGMILGSATTSAALAGDRLQGDLHVRADEVEARLALGFSGRGTIQPMARAALRAAATALASLLFVRLAAGRYLTPAHQFRRSLL